MHEGRIRNFISLGGNFQSASLDTAFVSKAMAKVSLFVHISTKPHRGHLVTGKKSIILPCLGRTEVDRQAFGPQFVTTENSMGVIEPSEGHLRPISPHLKSESAIIAGMAKATLETARKVALVNWTSLIENYDRIRDHIEKVVPGFARFNERTQEGTLLLSSSRGSRRAEVQDPVGPGSAFGSSHPRVTPEKARGVPAHDHPESRSVQHHHLRRRRRSLSRDLGRPTRDFLRIPRTSGRADYPPGKKSISRATFRVSKDRFRSFSSCLMRFRAAASPATFRKPIPSRRSITLPTEVGSQFTSRWW